MTCLHLTKSAVVDGVTSVKLTREPKKEYRDSSRALLLRSCDKYVLVTQVWFQNFDTF
jgi:hypothetical protein